MDIRAHVSLGSHPQYLPHDSFAHTAPKKIPITINIKPIINQ